MRTVWVHRDIDAPAERLWDLLTDLESWPEWGPTIRSADLRDQQLEAGAVGTITTAIGVEADFEVTAYDEGSRWAWRVVGIPATDHVVRPLDAARCRVGFGVPWPAAPYLAVCRVALHRLDRLSREDRTP